MDDELKLGLDFSPQAVFGGCVTAIWIYLIHSTGCALMDWARLLECTKKMQEEGGTFRYLVDGLPGLKGPAIDLGHKIVIRSIPRTGELIAFVEVLGVMRVGGVLAKSEPGSALLEHVYAYDLTNMTDRSREFWIDEGMFVQQDWRRVGIGPTDPEAPDALKAYFTRSLMQLSEIYYRQLTVPPASTSDEDRTPPG